ncbi:hypothetical protein QWJ90_14740 [Microbacterium oryzae]|uniref:hypothetical protein n=1 Tax=Microbacterium oryzae TaxID=743009 RepID=UPI0025AF8B3F|nr:hypothetical protein [Microbacterium oryzae]MDN3312187.1 hypothetical protein [Microbacterium oryzae]
MTDPERPHSSPDEPSTPLVPPPFAGTDQPAYGDRPPYAPSLPPYAGPSGQAHDAAASPAQYGYLAPPPPMSMPGGGGRNVVGLISLIAAIVGTVFAMIPGIFVIGWGLLPIAFVLAIVSLFQRGPKRAGIAGLVISVVGTILGVVVAIATFAFFLTASYEEAVDAGTRPDSGAVEQGSSRTDPLPLGATITSADWSVTINSVEFDATDAVLAENEINEQPAAGEEYILVNLSATYLGEAEGYPADVQVEYVTPDGVGIGGWETVTVVPDALDIGGALPADGRASGNTAFLVPSATARDGLLSVSPGILADEVFVSLE